MADYKKPGGYHKGGFKPRSDRGGFGDRGPRKELHKAECANCHKVCEVPFRPSGDRPVYCRDCFGGKSEAPRKEFSRAPRFERAPQARDTRIDEIKQQVAALNAKLDRAIETLEALSAAGTKKVRAAELTKAVKKVTKKPAKKKK